MPKGVMVRIWWCDGRKHEDTKRGKGPRRWRDEIDSALAGEGMMLPRNTPNCTKS